VNTQPLWRDQTSAARAAEARASNRRNHLERVLRHAQQKLQDLELATTRAALRGSMSSYEPTVRVLRNQIDGMRIDLALAEVELARATFYRKQIEAV
jgi:hypothetical protein